MDWGKTSVAVTTRKFSLHPELRARLTELFPSAKFYEGEERLAGTTLIEFLKGTDAAIVGLEPMTSTVLDAHPELNIIAKYGVGLDNVDCEHAGRLGKRLAWRGGVNKRSVAELTLNFLLGLARNTFFSGHSLKKGEWRSTGGFQLTGRTVGIVGCGFAGTEVLEILAPFKCRLLIHDILDKKETASRFGAELVDFQTLLKESDFVSLHVPLTETTRQLMNAHSLGLMKPSGYLINTARGPVVDQAALKEALQKGTIAGAALDVFEEEPPKDLEFLALPNLAVTPHIGGTSSEAILAMGMCAIEGLLEALDLQAPTSKKSKLLSNVSGSEIKDAIASTTTTSPMSPTESSDPKDPWIAR